MDDKEIIQRLEARISNLLRINADLFDGLTSTMKTLIALHDENVMLREKVNKNERQEKI